MQPSTLSKSRFKVALECPRKLVYASDKRYVNTNDANDLLKSLAEGGHQVGALAKLMYPGGTEITAASLDEQVQETERLLEAEEITLFEPTFRHGNLVVRVDVLVKNGHDIKLIEVKAKGFEPLESTFRGIHNPIDKAWRPYLNDVAFQTLVLERAHPEWHVTPYLMLLDTTAPASEEGVGAKFQVVTKGRSVEVKVQPGFEPTRLATPLLRAHDVTKEVRILRTTPVKTPAGVHEFAQLVEWLAEQLATGQDIPPFPGSQCKQCEFYCDPDMATDTTRSGWAECFEMAFHRRIDWPRSASVLGLYGYQNPGKLLAPNRLTLAEVDVADLNVKEISGEISSTQRYALQVEEARGEGDPVYLERETLRHTLAQWKFPLHFIDFETSRPALPFHVGRRPNDLLLFQFSHHILSEDGRLRHASECLIADPGVDPSITVVRALRDSLSGDNGTVVHWWDHEAKVLSEIQKKQIPESGETDREELITFIDSLVGGATNQGRLADLGRLISKTAFFQGTNGHSSVKKVLPAVLEKSELLMKRYGQPIYGTKRMPSLNYPAGWVWLQLKGGKVQDPYELLGSSLLLEQILGTVDQGDEDIPDNMTTVANGGDAMVVYAKLQRPDMSAVERHRLEGQLKRYCELDTLALVMVYDAIVAWIA